ncbi:hypothetical protein K1T71_010045 [Dendrolimus kikuchii]|uniref:Uncharacterized protein n=1 Tax=Dendrolimus kikuchii TaxID=765133 RepID=A0ACC1CQK7_9NEOP|nr:hypothetical protein K1T71_010045 [Dendrolimus kikuchii]
MWLKTKWVVLFSLWAARLVPQPTVIVQVSNGALRGLIEPDGSHRRYTGIPYATVTPEERFQAPKPLPKWRKTFNAYDEHIRCTQRFTKSTILGKEDCLTLNIYTPLEVTEPLPVMVFIHGGGFRDGSGTPFIYGPDYLIQHGVILVTFNYRVEILGFLCLGIKEAPGNAGLKDQVAALKWIKENISQFGGDPDNVTIFGESAGSASVLYHMLSPLSTGLFHKAIMQSGSAMSPWTLQFEPLKIASRFAKHLGHNTENPHEIITILKKILPEKLMSTRIPRNEGDIVLSENIFVPCIEKEIEGVDQFLMDSPYNLLSKGRYNRVPIIIGHNDAEGLMFVGKENDTTISQMDFYKALPRDLIFPTDKEKRHTANILKELYMGDKIISKNTLPDFAKYEGDSSITFPVLATIDLLLNTNDIPMYVYKFSYEGLLNLAKITYGFWKESGATHADELFYMFKIKAKLLIAYKEIDMITRMTTMWTNFAKYGNPTPVLTSPFPIWPPASKDNLQLLEINRESSKVPVWNNDIVKFWNETYSKYRRKY